MSMSAVNLQRVSTMFLCPIGALHRNMSWASKSKGSPLRTDLLEEVPLEMKVMYYWFQNSMSAMTFVV
jgi:hypothetical protein